MTNPLNPNYKTGVGQLVTYRSDFESHIIGTNWRHQANQIDLSPILTIGGTAFNNVQSAITQLNTLILPPVIPQATIGNLAANLGVITLGGDLGGAALTPRVINIQSKPISVVPPTLNQVLTWNGSAWTPMSAISAFGAAGDLAGNSVTQTVIGLTGTAGIINIHGTNLLYDTSVVNPIITQTITSGTASPFSIIGQSTSFASGAGGNVIISGGAPGAGGLRGGAQLQLNNTTLVEVVEPLVNQRFVSLARGSGLTSAQLNTGSGDLVVYISHAATVPSVTGAPIGGSIIYSSAADHQVHIRQDDGNDVAIGSLANPTYWGDLVNFPFAGQTITYRQNIITTTSTQFSIFQFALSDKTSVRFDVVMIGKQNGKKDSIQYNLSMGYCREDADGGSFDIGSTTSTDTRNTTGTTWPISPTITRSSNTVSVSTGASLATTIYWVAIIQVSISQSLT